MSEYYHPFISHDPRLNYGKDMTDCEFFGIAGCCGKKCPVFIKKECPTQEEIEESEE
jgi:hypothetical protein